MHICVKANDFSSAHTHYLACTNYLTQLSQDKKTSHIYIKHMEELKHALKMAYKNNLDAVIDMTTKQQKTIQSQQAENDTLKKKTNNSYTQFSLIKTSPTSTKHVIPPAPTVKLSTQ